MTSCATTKEVAGALDVPLAMESSDYLEKHTLPLQDNVSSLDCDCDSLSDGREKADTTPENLKKIDDVIETSVVVVDSLRSHFWSHPSGVAADSTQPAKTIRTADGDESVSKLDIDMDDKTTQRRHENETVSSTSPPSTATVVAESSFDSTSTTATKHSFAFTIDHFNDKDCDPAAAQARYKSMLERFQQRHRRGASMSKLESSSAGESLSMSCSASPLTKGMTKSLNAENGDSKADADMATKSPSSNVKLRARDRSTSRVRDSSKRHSWSPRSSTHELTQQSTVTNKTPTTTNHQQPQQSQQQQCQVKSQSSRSRQINSASLMPPQSVRKTNVTKIKPKSLHLKNASKVSCDVTSVKQQFTARSTAMQQFTPRSTAMQLALQKVDYLGAQPPLADLKHLNNDSDADNISETGTYTLDGDNYTEEQKDLMNIDKTTSERAHEPIQAAQTIFRRSPDLQFGAKLLPVTKGNSRKNVLEVNYYHEPEPATPRHSSGNDFMLSQKSATSYLEKIKTRVLRNMSVSKNAVQDQTCDMIKVIESQCADVTPSSDVGTFTSVTTSGVLAKQCALDACPKPARRTSLSTSQIDSSEYVTNESKLKQSVAAAYAGGGFTDHQKAEYRLNVFTNQKESHTFSAPNRSFIQTPPESPTTAYKDNKPCFSDAAVLKTAQNKSDWIQEWARNARARSLASCEGSKSRKQLQTQELMTRSYTCSETGGESLTDEGVINAQLPPAHCNKSNYRLNGGREFDYVSDPAISSTCGANLNDEGHHSPKSPSKIPSPIHSLGRTRKAGRSHACPQNVVHMDAAEADSCLQRTAAAINNLQQSLSRKSSQQSPHSGSPRPSHLKMATRQFYSPEDQSPQHSLESPTESSGGGVVNTYQEAMLRKAHKRNLSMGTYNRDEPPQQHQHQLMTSSYNEQQMKLLTGGTRGAPEYAQQRLRGRKSSYDGSLEVAMPNSPVASRNRSNWGAQMSREGHRTRFVDQQEASSLSPLRRSSSYSVKKATMRHPQSQILELYTMPPDPKQPPNPDLSIKKSSSTNNFINNNVYSDYDENLVYYIKDVDEGGCYADVDEFGRYYSSGEEGLPESDGYQLFRGDVSSLTEKPLGMAENDAGNVPLPSTRYNKVLLMRIEQSKLKVAGKAAPSSAGSKRTAVGGGAAACPNTPELPRRNIKSAPRPNTTRQSMPRDSSLNRLAGHIPNSLASAKKQLLQTAAAVPIVKPSSTGRVQPKYLDISKYKPAQGNNFLRKNDAKSTLKSGAADASIKRSPSSGSMGLSRNDGTRASNRSAKSTTPSLMTTSGSSLASRAASALRRDVPGAKQKEAEMAIWKRRSKYDPMKAAAEDRRKKELAKKMAQTKIEFNNERPSRSPYRRGHHL